MSRRSLLDPDETLRLAQRRGVMGARMFSEAPIRPGAGPQQVFALEPDTTPAVIPAEYMIGTEKHSWVVKPGVPDPNAWVDVKVTQSNFVTPLEGTDLLVCATTTAITESTIDPSWTVLHSGNLGGNRMRWWWLTKPNVSGATTYTVGTVSQTMSDVDGHTSAQAIGITFKGQSSGSWHVDLRDTASGYAPLRLTGPAAGTSPTCRAQMLVGQGWYSGWVGNPPRPENGLSFTFQGFNAQMGWDQYLLERSFNWKPIAGRWDQPFVQGSFDYTYGIYGTPYWALFDVWYG